MKRLAIIDWNCALCIITHIYVCIFHKNDPFKKASYHLIFVDEVLSVNICEDMSLSVFV